MSHRPAGDELKSPRSRFFPIPIEAAHDDGREALNPDNLVCRALSAIKREFPDLGLAADVALDPYTSHGQDGLLEDGKILNDETVAVLVEQAKVLAEAGCDVVAPSDMMDGRVGAIRKGLDAADQLDVKILAYTARMHPPSTAFRARSHKATLPGDKRTIRWFRQRRRSAARACSTSRKAPTADGEDGLPISNLWRVRAWHADVVYQVGGYR